MRASRRSASTSAWTWSPTRGSPDTTRAEQLLDWRPTVPSEEGLRRTVAWFAEQLQAADVRAG